jgi:sec-independent protein translocase protein TatC
VARFLFMLDQLDDSQFDAYVEEQMKKREAHHQKLEGSQEKKDLSFLGHLEELRWHLVRAVLAVLIVAIIAILNKEIVFGTIILGPSTTDFFTYQMFCKLGDFLNSTTLCIDNLPFVIQNRTMTGQFTMHLTASFVLGVILAFPYVFWEIWRFVKPALYTEEKSAIQGTTFVVSFLFFSGVAFGYFLVVPLSINFLSNYQVDASVINEFDLTSYVSTITNLTLVSGIMFQLPVISFYLGKIGLANSEMMRNYRKHSIVIILALSAILTPPDIMSQVLVSLPLIGLYQVSISVVRKVNF